jgi:hypothetical protein
VRVRVRVRDRDRAPGLRCAWEGATHEAGGEDGGEGGVPHLIMLGARSDGGHDLDGPEHEGRCTRLELIEQSLQQTWRGGVPWRGTGERVRVNGDPAAHR